MAELWSGRLRWRTRLGYSLVSSAIKPDANPWTCSDWRNLFRGLGASTVPQVSNPTTGPRQ